MLFFPLRKHLKIPEWLMKAFQVPLSYIYWLSLHFELISSIHHNRKETLEPPKPITRYSRWGVIGIFAPQLLPIAASSALLYVNYSNVYFEPPGIPNQNARLNALQFGAKTHEVLITISLSAIILHYIQYELLHGRGIPLGSLLASFQVTYLGTLWSPGLWATTSAGSSKAHRALLIVLIVFALLIAAIVGPASAILMVPSLGCWNHTTIHSKMPEPGMIQPYSSSKSYKIFVGADQSILWPDMLSATTFPPDCNATDGQIPVYCPLGGLSVLLGEGNPDWDFDAVWDVSMKTVTSGWDTYTDHIQGGQPGGGVIPQYNCSELDISMTTSSFAGNLLKSIPENWYSGDSQKQNAKVYLIKAGGPLLAPVVYSLCNASSYKWIDGDFWEWSADEGASNPGSKLTEFTLPLMAYNQTWSSNASQLLSIWENATQSATLWVEPPDLGSLAPSIGGIYAGPVTDWTENATSYLTEIMTCSMFATWQSVDTYMNISATSDVYSPFIFRSLSSLLGLTASTPLQPQHPIKIDINWANSALPPNDTVGKFARTIGVTGNQAMGPYDPYDSENISTVGFGVASSIFLADVMSRTGLTTPKFVYQPASDNVESPSTYYSRGHDAAGNSDFGLLTDTPDDPNDYIDSESTNITIISYTANNMTEFRVALIRYGYVYSMEGSTRRIAAGILLVHMFVAVVYMILVVWFGWSCYGLRSLIEILVLAINSNPSEKLNNTCAGVSRLDTYKHVVKVREVSGTRVGFVFDDDGSCTTPVPGKLYGQLISRGVQAGESKNSMASNGSMTEEIKKINSF